MLAQSQDRVSKERAMRRRQLKGLCKRLKQLRQMELKRDELLKKLGAALHDFPTAARLMETAVAPKTAQLSFSLRKDKLREARKREGRYLLRSNIVSGHSPEELWHFYIQLTQGRENGLYIFRGIRKEKVDVTGETWIAVVDDGLAAHHDVLYLMSLEQPDEFQDVRRKVGGLY